MMRPGLVHDTLTFFPSNAPKRCAFPNPDHELLFPEESAVALPGPASSKTFRVSHMPTPQTRRFLCRPYPATEVVNTAGIMCPERPLGREGTVVGCGSSGSDHDPSSVCLAAMVNEFMENEPQACDADSCTECSEIGSVRSMDGKSNGPGEIFQGLKNLACCADDREAKLLKDVEGVISEINEAEHHWHVDGHVISCMETHLKRTVMSGLQRRGYNAAVCKTRWDHSGGMPGGYYEYIDVLCTPSSHPLRLLVDIDFQAQFEIARPTSEFCRALQMVPQIFVGSNDRLQRIVHLMSEATKQSLHAKGLHLPPWRKLNYMKAKWSSPYKRTSNSVAIPLRSTVDKEGDLMNVARFKCMAVRGCGLDPRSMDELDILYHGSNVIASQLSCKRDESIIVMSTDWQLPTVEGRAPFAANARKVGKITGLAAMFMRAGTQTSNEIAAKAA